MKLSANSIVQQFVPKEIYKTFGEQSMWFVSDNIVKLYEFLFLFFTNYFKEMDATIEQVEIVINNWHDEKLIKLFAQTFNNRGLRTVQYINSQIEKGIKTAMLSQHVGGSTNAIDFNIVLHYKNGKMAIIPSNVIYDIILKNEKKFMEAGLTTLENKTITKGWTHADCRYTGLKNLLIVNP